MVARKKCGVTNQDLVARQMKRARNEISKVEQLEQEREFKSAIDKMSIVKLAHKLKDVLAKMEDAKVNEKALLTHEIIEMRDTFQDREKRLNSELQNLRAEKDKVFVKLTSLDMTDAQDRKELADLIRELKEGAEAREGQTQKENQSIMAKAKKLQDKMAKEAPKDKVKVYKKGTGQRVPVKKAAFLTPSRQVDRALRKA